MGIDHYESYFSKYSYEHLRQKVSWLIQPMGQLMVAHLESLSDYRPLRGSKSFDMANVVAEFIDKSLQSNGRSMTPLHAGSGCAPL